MYRAQSSQAVWVPSEEVVDDSEPERVQRRKNRQQVQRTSHSHSSRGQCTKSLMVPNTNSVIEISDSDSESSPSTSQRRGDLQQFQPSCQLGGIDSSSMSTTSPSRLATSVGRTTLNLNRFAYTSTIPKQKSPASLVPPASTTTTSNPTSGHREVSTKAGTPLEISNSDLGKVLKCICCDTTWTTRKSGPQKMAHIRTCAKKFALDEETVQILIQKEIALYLRSEREKSRKSGPPEEPTANPKTFLEEVLVDAGPKRRGRRQQAETLLANVSQTRGVILARAQAIIDTTTPDESGIFPSNDVQAKLQEEVRMPPPTQHFAQSTLGQLQGARRGYIFENESGPLRLTQKIAPSGLARLQGSKTRSPSPDDWSSQHDGDEDHGLRSRRNSRSPFQELEDDMGQLLSGPVNPACESECPIGKRTKGAMNDVWLRGVPLGPSDLSCIQSRSGISPIAIAGSPQPNPVLTPAKTGRKARSRAQFTASSENEKVEVAPVTPKRARRPKAKGSSNKKTTRVQYDFGQKWESHMKEHIVKDSDLHMRVLRYEPIHFDVFLQLAQLYAPSSRQMKLQLQNFLDNQAIHFYGAEGIAWKR